MDKKPFSEQEAELNECIQGLNLVRISDNDIYLSADANLPAKFNGLLEFLDLLITYVFSEQVYVHLPGHWEAHHKVPLQATAFDLWVSGRLQNSNFAVHWGQPVQRRCKSIFSYYVFNRHFLF